MKTHIRIIITISLLSSLAFIANAQGKFDRKQVDAPWISKDVVRVGNKEALITPSLTIKSIGTPDAVISKDVLKERRRVRKSEAEGNVVSKGYPEWIISKPASRVQG